ncbi:MAG: hypothetical protein ABI867_04430 [Kofleriaceae bacterium]
MRWVWVLVVAGCSFEPGERATDAPPPFDPAQDCPFNYDVALTGQPSRYRLIAVERKMYEHADDCADDLEGATHLVAFNRAEVEAVSTFLNARPEVNRLWLGGVQLRGQASSRAGWFSIVGGLMADVWGGGEPNDANQPENNEENFVGIDRNRSGLIDFPVTFTGGVLCECDGQPVDLVAAAAIDAMRD